MDEIKLEPFDIHEPLGIRVRNDLCDSPAPSFSSDQAPTMAGANSGGGGGGVAAEPPLPNTAAASNSKHYRSVSSFQQMICFTYRVTHLLGKNLPLTWF